MGDCVMLKDNYDLELLIEDVNIAVNESNFIPKVYRPGLSYKLFSTTKGWSSIAMNSINGGDNHESSILNKINFNSKNIYKPSRILKKCEYFKKVLKELNTEVYLVRLMKLKAGGIITPHNDGIVFDNRNAVIRCHLPIVTNKNVRFGIANCNYYMSPGKLWYTRVDKDHWVKNNSDEDRIHLVIDIRPTKEMFEQLELYKDKRQLSTHRWNTSCLWQEYDFFSDTLYISFCGLGINGIQKFIFFNTLKKKNIKKLFLKDSTKTWYLNGIPGFTNSVNSTLIYIKEKIKQSNCKNVVMIGSSAGGFGALLYGNLLNVNKVIVFNPQTYLDVKTRLKYNETRWETQNLKSIQKSNNLYKNLNILDKSTTYNHIIFSNNYLDQSHFTNIKENKNLNINGVRVTTSTHLLSKYLKDTGYLNKFLEI